MKKYNVLVFPCSTEIANEIINSLQYHKYFRLHFASSVPVSYCNYREKEINILPYITESSFESRLNELVERKKINFIIPAHDDVSYILSLIEDKINAKIIGQSRKVNEIVRFKDKTYKYFENILPIPKVFAGKPKKEEFPVFTKPLKGQGSFNSQKLNSLKEHEAFFELNKREEFIVMEFLPGEEFTIDCFSDKGKVLYFGARTREKTTRGISIQSTFVSDDELNRKFENYANIISESLQLHGIFFFQMKFDSNRQLKLLEIGPRVAGTMMLNRVRGVNFVELALYQALGYDIEIAFNQIEVSLARALVPIYKHNISYENIYIDFDDTLFLDEKFINPDIIRLIFQEKNKGKKIYLITKNKKLSLANILHKFGIAYIFDEIIHINEDKMKANFMKPSSILIDDSFSERKEAIKMGNFAFDCNSIALLFDPNGGMEDE